MMLYLVVSFLLVLLVATIVRGLQWCVVAFISRVDEAAWSLDFPTEDSESLLLKKNGHIEEHRGDRQL
jgi:hypothetical protein